MTTIAQVRGALLEEAVLYLLKNVGYEPINASMLPATGLRNGHSGLEAQGRGAWHQLDALSSWTHSPPFMYPLRLIVEAKCYRQGKPVEIEVVRNSIGVLKDVSENYFSMLQDGTVVQGPRFNYVAAIFSTSGFTRGAVQYAVAHQIFLIQYTKIPAIAPLIEAIANFSQEHILELSKKTISQARDCLRRALNGPGMEGEMKNLTPEGMRHIERAIRVTTERIQGSYFGMLQGRWPMHLLRRQPLPPEAFVHDTVRCAVRGNVHGEWKFVPLV